MDECDAAMYLIASHVWSTQHFVSDSSFDRLQFCLLDIPSSHWGGDSMPLHSTFTKKEQDDNDDDNHDDDHDKMNGNLQDDRNKDQEVLQASKSLF